MIKGNVRDIYKGKYEKYVELIRDMARSIPEGKYDLYGGAYYSVVTSKSRPIEDALFEAHRKYIDLQYILTGSETMGCAYLGSVKETVEYSEEKDCAFYSGEGELTLYNEGDFVFFFPEDAHMPAVGEGSCKKVIVKIPVED